MARMIPPLFDQTTTSAAERTLFYKLQDGLADDWTVIHSLPYLEERGRYRREGECDFLLLHPRHGLLVIEAKSGAPEYDGQRQEWRYDDGSRLKNPFEQATRALHVLQDLLRRRQTLWAEAELAFGYAVAFPDARSVLGNLPPGFAIDMLLLEPAIENIQATVIRLLGRLRPALSEAVPGALDSALEVLTPSFSLTPALKPVIARAHREFLRLSGEQSELMANLADQPRMVIHGGAGTGKTLLVSAVARQEAAAGKAVLVLCFNRPLAADLAQALPDLAVHTFHGLCEEILRATGTALPDASRPDYWDDLLPNAALTALPRYERRFQEILVDEGQDFRADWWLLVEEMLDTEVDNGWLIFCDEHQNLFDRSGVLPFAQPSWTLRANRRNTRQIADFVRGAVGQRPTDPGISLPEGPAPVVHRVSDAAGERAAVQKVLHALVQEQGVSPDDIVIIDPHVLDRSSFASHRKLGNLTVRGLDDPPAANSVRHATAKKFKGLEADCVLLTGVGMPSRYYHGEQLRRFVYVGGSRARVVLHVFEWADWRGI